MTKSLKDSAPKPKTDDAGMRARTPFQGKEGGPDRIAPSEALERSMAHFDQSILTGQLGLAIVALECLHSLSAEERSTALSAMKQRLDGIPMISIDNLNDSGSLRAAAFVLGNLRVRGWDKSDGWGQIKQTIDTHSKMLADSLVWGIPANEAGSVALEALAFLALCGSHPYSAEDTKSILKRFIDSRDASAGYFNLTGVLMKEGSDEQKAVASKMEGKRVKLAIENLGYADDRQFEGANELINLFGLGREHLIDTILDVAEEMHDIAENPHGQCDEESAYLSQKAMETLDHLAQVAGGMASEKLAFLLGLTMAPSEASDEKKAEAALFLRKLGSVGLVPNIELSYDSGADAGLEAQILHAKGVRETLRTYQVDAMLSLCGENGQAVAEALAREDSAETQEGGESN
jgi:hypothetical protein